MRHFILFCFLLIQSLGLASSWDHVPAAYKGRFRPTDTYAQLWLYDFYHHPSLKNRDLAAFHTDDSSALDLLWNIHFLGVSDYEEAPLFWIRDPTLFQLNPKSHRFSYRQLAAALYPLNDVVKKTLTYHFLKSYYDPSNRGKAEKIQLSTVAPGLWLALHGEDLVIAAAPSSAPWESLQSGQVVHSQVRSTGRQLIANYRSIADEVTNTWGMLLRFQQMKSIPDEPLELEAQHPTFQRLAQAGVTFLLLPSRLFPGTWYSLKALKLKTYNPSNPSPEPIANFTLYSDAQFETIRTLYLELEQAYLAGKHEQRTQLSEKLADALAAGYVEMQGKPYQEAFGKKLSYPTFRQLKVESFYSQAPLTPLCLTLYALTCLLLTVGWLRHSSRIHFAGLVMFLLAFALHTALLALRIYILQRPPVSNMFETVIYVPWIAVSASLLLYLRFKNMLLLLASATLSAILLMLIELTKMNNSLENVQAVLDSQYWLIVHVLMVVGSYGLFLLSGILGHLYLIGFTWHKIETPHQQFVGKMILQTMYAGVALLISGTILGGVWAAQSWGRFWDWDPKEAWAFISCCIYLLWIHAYTFHRIRFFGLAVGSIVGLLAIAFTWYGVNYILGTGLHSYGFGTGGELYFYLFVGAELLFLGVMSFFVPAPGPVPEKRPKDEKDIGHGFGLGHGHEKRKRT